MRLVKTRKQKLLKNMSKKYGASQRNVVDACIISGKVLFQNIDDNMVKKILREAKKR